VANTYSQIYIQIVFAVLGRRNLIRPEIKEDVQKFISGVIRNRQQKLLAINCMPDHVHIFISIKPDIMISGLVGDIKTASSNLINANGWIKGKFSWQEGFGAFSYSQSHIDRVVKYILNQERHHRKKTFREEYMEFLDRFHVDFNETYLFKWIE
jgi:putative transposase